MHMDFIVGVPKVEEALAAFRDIKKGDKGLPGTPGLNGKDVTPADVEAAVRKYLVQPKNGIGPTPEQVAEVVLTSPKLFALIKRKLKKLDVLLEQQEGEDATPAQTIVAMVMEGLAQKPLDMGQIKGLDAKLAEIHNHVRAQGQWRGGGDTVVAGTGVTITNTVNGNKSISASGGVGAWQTPVEVPNGVITAFTVGLVAPTDVVADSSSFFNGAGYTYAAGQITFDNPPTQYVRYR